MKDAVTVKVFFFKYRGMQTCYVHFFNQNLCQLPFESNFSKSRDFKSIKRVSDIHNANIFKRKSVNSTKKIQNT